MTSEDAGRNELRTNAYPAYSYHIKKNQQKSIISMAAGVSCRRKVGETKVIEEHGSALVIELQNTFNFDEIAQSCDIGSPRVATLASCCPTVGGRAPSMPPEVKSGSSWT